ncbi:hypothetical protein AYL99_11755 [Fonsecaea erecta]|uniref:Uncharacterized protein n=1 Tax=Fonsecaea erecta TaxID=1367422 RepID=A0A178Z4H3_9EURO|nr:hypothetical protein AYL99_11755 [Fonsecaea erecta]OAP53995.1 hypothetical protein AYL99_11755 [Fonsecaea erecta]
MPESTPRQEVIRGLANTSGENICNMVMAGTSSKLKRRQNKVEREASGKMERETEEQNGKGSISY